MFLPSILFLLCVMADANFYDDEFGPDQFKVIDRKPDRSQPLVSLHPPENIQPPSTIQPNMSVVSLAVAPGRRSHTGRRSHRRQDPSGHSIVSTPTAVESQSRNMIIPEL